MESKTKIIKSAIKIFLVKGYDATSMKDVVLESNTSKGGIYHHFKNKKELFLQCIDFMFDEFEKWEMELYSQTTNIKEILQIYFSSLADIHKFVRNLADSEDVTVDSFYLLMMEAFTKFPEIKKKHYETHAQNMQFLTTLMEKAKQENVIRNDIDCDTLGFLVNALAEGTVIYNILNEKINLTEIGKKLFKIIWDGITVEEE